MRTPVEARRIVIAALATASVLSVLPATGADARTPSRPALASGHRGDGYGNGRGNNNAITINSPSRVSGMQNVGNSNAGGSGNVDNAYCGGRHRCSIRQHQLTRTR